MTSAVGIAGIERFRSIVANRLGLHLEEARTGFLGEVLECRLAQTGQPCKSYLELLSANGAREELSALARVLTVGETYFFRNIDQFRAFSAVALPNRLKVRASQKNLRLLSAGCASGEEAYSLAILLREATIDPSWNISILAVDINPAMIAAAIKARFSSWALRETPPEVQRRWLRSASANAFSLDASLGNNIRFEVRNLVEDDPGLWQPETYDVIFCRNTIMYFTSEACRAVVAHITRALAPGGFLFLGHAETLRSLSLDFHLHHTHGTFYYQRRASTHPCAGPPVFAATPSSGVTRSTPSFEVENSDMWIDTIRKATERIQVLSDARPTHVEPDGPHPPNSKASKWDLALPLELLQTEHFIAALDVIQALPAESAGDTDVLLLHAVLLANRGHFTASQNVCRSLLEIDELNAGAHYVLALCHEGSGDSVEAASHDQVAVYLDPSFAMPHLHLGLLARRRSERDGAQRELGQALALLQREDPSRLLLFGGGFSRHALIALCSAELTACGGSHD